MHDIRLIREEPEKFDEALRRRFYPLAEGDRLWSEVILELDAKVRDAVGRKQEAEQTRNQSSKLIG